MARVLMARVLMARASRASTLPPLVRGLCDDASIFPPGLKPLADAVPDHRAHTDSAYAELVGPFIISADRLDELATLADPAATIRLTVTVPAGVAAVPEVLTKLAASGDGVRLVGLEIVPVGMSGAEVVGALDELALDPAITVWVEVPRDERRPGMIEALARTRYGAKFRTGGVRADLYPDDGELAAAISACAAAGLPFKATAGLHQAIRNTDDRGFEQHGFVNILAATHLALTGADTNQVQAALADRNPDSVVRSLQLSEAEATAVRRCFVSFGTCSIDDPRQELTELGLM